jgi:hypothetical protein
MALTSKKYEKFYETTGSGADKIDTTKLTNVTNAWATEKAEGCQKYLDDPIIAPLIYQLQQMQDEIDYLRTEISANKDKATFPGLGTSSGTALAGDTTVISKAQADAITVNTAKTSMVIGKNANEAMAGNTTIPNVTVVSDSGLVVQFTNLTVGAKSTTIELKITDHNQKSAPTYTAVITLK